MRGIVVAGNDSTASTSFTIDVTADGLDALIDAFTANASVRTVLHRDVDALATAKPKQRASIVRAFERYARSQAGRGDLTQQEADILVAAFRVLAG